MGNSGGHYIPYYIPIDKGWEILMLGWDQLKRYHFLLGDLDVTLHEIFIGSALLILAGYVVRQIFDW